MAGLILFFGLLYWIHGIVAAVLMYTELRVSLGLAVLGAIVWPLAWPIARIRHYLWSRRHASA